MRIDFPSRLVLAGLLLSVSLAARASPTTDPTPPEQDDPVPSALCLLEVPGGTTTRFVNLAIVQYVELSKDRLRLVFGGGNFGSGYEADFPVKSRDEALALLRRIEQHAQRCQTGRPPLP